MLRRFLLSSCLIASFFAQEIESDSPDESVAGSGASVFTEGSARTMRISIPAPRGLILDRDGRPLAQTKMAYHLAIDFTAYRGKPDPDLAAAWAQDRIAEANALVPIKQTFENPKLANYYRDRRWLPFQISPLITEKEAKGLEEKIPTGLTLLPIYQRFYPENSIGAHLIGYVGADTILPSGPINDGDPLFRSVVGKDGFEMIFDKTLRGEPGIKKLIFDRDGNKIVDEIVKRPRPGGNVITTIDLDWQRYAERVLREGSKRGAMVVIDIQTGEVLVMASRPTFDLNEFVPFITEKRYEELKSDPSAPLFGRAFMSEYPPASTFKPVITLAAISSGSIRSNQQFNCPYQIKIGEKWFRNHSRGDQGFVGPERALAKSINPWFYQVGIKTGPQNFLSVARRLGFGTKTGLPLVGETAGNAPTPEYIQKVMGRPTTDGDTANLSIGQGLVTASPLQVAQSMAAIGNGSVLMQLQLVRQIQDFHGRVIEAPTFTKRNDLNLTPKAVAVTHTGMKDVVHAGYGTGKQADLGFTIMCGKTGTAQWKPAIQQNLAWFSGFFPYKDPRYAFAVVYEGVPGETVSGGRNAAPLVKRFFRNFRTEIEENLKAPAKALVIIDEDEEPLDSIPTAIPVAIPIEDDEFEDIPMPEDQSDSPVLLPLDESLGDLIPEAERVPEEEDENEEIPEAEPIPTVPETPADLPRRNPPAPADE